MYNNAVGRNLKILITLFSLTALYGVYYWGIPAVINLPERTGYITEKVFEETGYKISLTNPSLKMGLTPSVWLAADNFSILNDDNTKALNIENPHIGLKIIPLIFNNIDIKQFSTDKININLVFDKDLKLKLGQYLIEKPPVTDITLKHAKINIDDYSVQLDDKYQSKKLHLDGKYLTINDFTNGKHIDLSTVAQFSAGNKNSDINLKLNLPFKNIEGTELSGHIVNLDLSDFSVYAKSLSKNQIKSLSGIINLTAKTENNVKTTLQIKNLGIFKDDLASSVYSKDKIEIKTDFVPINKGIDINEMRLSADGINAFTSGKITKLDSKIPELDLKVSVFDTKAEKVISLLPGEAELSPDMNLLLLKQTGFWADASGNLEIKGKADFPNIYGNILVKNAYMVKPILNAKKATIKLIFTGNKFNLDVKVPTDKTETVWVKGPINLDKDRTADLHITSTNNVDLKTAQIVLNPLHDILHFDLGPVPVMDIKGKGGINLHVVGTRKDPHGWGQFHFKDATVSFLDIHNMVLHNGSGTLDFDNQNTLFQSKIAILNGKPVSVRGTCSLIGKLDFDITSNGQNLNALLNTIKTSPMLEDIQKLLSPVENASGIADLKINLTGQVKDPKDMVFNKNIFAKGSIKLLSDSIKLKGLPASISHTSGIVNFNNLNADFNLESNLYSSKIKTSGEIKDNNCNVKLSSNRFNLADAVKLSQITTPYNKDLATINTSFTAKYNGKLDNIEPNKIYLNGKIYSNKGAKSSLIVNDSTYELNNSNLKLPMLKGTFKNSPYYLSLNVTNMFSPKRILNGYGKINSFDLNIINDKNLYTLLPAAKQLKDIQFLNGKINLSARVKNNNFNVFSILDDISLIYLPQKTKLTINSGNLLLRNNILNLNKINAQLSEMPLFINGKISDIYQNPYLNLYINSKPSQEFFDIFFNNKSVYPIKMKGDANLSSKLTGSLKNLNAKSTLNINENSRLYYMGATIGDIENPVRITIDSNYLPDKLKIHSLQYDKIITSQNNKPFATPQLNASGTLTLLPDNNVGFNNFRVKTQTPTDAKIFNIIFRKPFMKQGVFTSDLLLNGTSISPKINGKLDITSIDIPFFESAIRDVNLDFKNDRIFITSRGTVFTNDINLNAIMKNKLTPPYILDDIKLKLANLDVNKITDTLRDIEADATRNPSYASTGNKQFDITQLIINKAEINADKITVRNINADNFISTLQIDKNQLLNVDNFKFDIAEGSVNGSFKHNIANHKTDLNIHLNNANAAIMSEALFDLKGQVYGSVNGDFILACNGNTNDKCFKTLSGAGTFKIADGRMPKLGSLEYLLKAGNLIKGGFTGLSINSLVDLVTPLKTGNFESISGDMHIENGIADKINIYSSGNDLNMYMTGSYNITTSVADMKILGSLTKNITTVFGKIKNASLNTLFNTIPGINDSTEKLLLQSEISKIPNIKNVTNIYRIFAVDINGDINGSDYVKSFKWVK